MLAKVRPHELFVADFLDRNYHHEVFCNLQSIYLLRLFGIVFLFLPTVAPAQSNVSPETHQQTATRALKEGRYDDAIREYRLVLKDVPGNAEILSNVGIAYHLKGEYPQAVAAFQEALKEKPGLVAANLFLGIDNLKLNKPSEAIPPLLRVLRSDPRNPDALLALGVAYLGQRKYLQAISEFREVSQNFPTNPETWYQLGKAYLKVGDDATNHLWQLDPDLVSVWGRLLQAEVSLGQGRYLTAESSLKKIAAAYPSLAGVHGDLGRLYLLEGEGSKAEKEFHEEVKLPWPNLGAWNGLMVVALLKGDVQAASLYVDRVIEVEPAYLTHKADASTITIPEGLARDLIRQLDQTTPDPTYVLYLKGFLYAQLGDSETARKYFRAFADSTLGKKGEGNKLSTRQVSDCSSDFQSGRPRPTDSSSQLLQAGCLYFRGEQAQAFSRTNSVLSRDPDDLEGLFWLAKTSQDLALSAFGRLAELDPSSYRTHQLQGEIYAAEFKLNEGVKEYQEAIRQMPSLASLHLELGMLYGDHAKYDLGIAEVQRALELSPGDFEANYVLGDIYVKTNQAEQATPYLERAVGEDPGFLKAHLALAKAYRAQDRFKDAIEQFKAALALDRSGEIYYQLASLYRKLGYRDQAQEEFKVSERIRAQRLAAARKRGIFPLESSQDKQ